MAKKRMQRNCVKVSIPIADKTSILAFKLQIRSRAIWKIWLTDTRTKNSYGKAPRSHSQTSMTAGTHFKQYKICHSTSKNRLNWASIRPLTNEILSTSVPWITTRETWPSTLFSTTGSSVANHTVSPSSKCHLSKQRLCELTVYWIRPRSMWAMLISKTISARRPTYRSINLTSRLTPCQNWSIFTIWNSWGPWPPTRPT